jgi:hypothetical protein
MSACVPFLGADSSVEGCLSHGHLYVAHSLTNFKDRHGFRVESVGEARLAESFGGSHIEAERCPV